ncbi:hypothetical protein SETIT_2G375400v2 [Setaria italica]|uniref:Uncharacterized protein n=2 Tax=Setaria TaxID=4554 RepID=A0A368Q7G3_SETIT|nr:hypothetical protein SETIT_2G375400v2 [Setaria italica]TKW35617.1 hypothetical protein SEVIR_2G386600v2 [Setaria viridis]
MTYHLSVLCYSSLSLSETLSFCLFRLRHGRVALFNTKALASSPHDIGGFQVTSAIWWVSAFTCWYMRLDLGGRQE